MRVPLVAIAVMLCGLFGMVWGLSASTTLDKPLTYDLDKAIAYSYACGYVDGEREMLKTFGSVISGTDICNKEREAAKRYGFAIGDE
jgi:hypothetical protein